LYQWLAIASGIPQFISLTPTFLVPDGKWGYTFEKLYSSDFTGQNAIVMGTNSGVGYETSLALAQLGTSITLACQNPTKCKAAVEKIQSSDSFKGKLSTMTLDTLSLVSVKKFSEQYLSEHEGKPLNFLYLNAGIGLAGANDDGSAPLSEDGIEMVFATNHVGDHLLWKLPHPLIIKSNMARIVLTSSAASYDSFKYKVATDLEILNNVNVVKENMHIYGQSKLAQVLWAKKLTQMLGPNSTIFVNAIHPWAVNTGIWQKNPMIPALIQDFITYLQKNVMWTAADGALTMLYLGVATTRLVEENVGGKYFHPKSQSMVSPLALDVELQNPVWDFSDELVKDYS
jgi:NAD(P)-dependent dehydrogenase (short-subunit alcohol dehydrogenase family)